MSEKEKGCYTGPIEQVKPGDVLDQGRFQEYREFMKTKGLPSIKLWGRHEQWEDNKNRPFGGGWEPPKTILPPPPEAKMPLNWTLSKEALASKLGIKIDDIDKLPDNGLTKNLEDNIKDINPFE